MSKVGCGAMIELKTEKKGKEIKLREGKSHLKCVIVYSSQFHVEYIKKYSLSVL